MFETLPGWEGGGNACLRDPAPRQRDARNGPNQPPQSKGEMPSEASIISAFTSLPAAPSLCSFAFTHTIPVAAHKPLAAFLSSSPSLAFLTLPALPLPIILSSISPATTTLDLWLPPSDENGKAGLDPRVPAQARRSPGAQVPPSEELDFGRRDGAFLAHGLRDIVPGVERGESGGNRGGDALAWGFLRGMEGGRRGEFASVSFLAVFATTEENVLRLAFA